MSHEPPTTPQPPNAPGNARRRLRLSTILLELAESAEPVELQADPPANPAVAKPEEHKSRRGRLLTNITVGDIVDRTRSAGFGFAVALLGLVSVPFPGISVPFGLAIALAGLQMMCGMQRPWLPRVVRRYKISVKTLGWMERRLYRWTAGLERGVRPRFEILTRGLFWNLCGLGVLLLAIGLALPFPIPFSNLFFVVPLLIYAIGLLEGDGLLIMLGHAIVAVDMMLAVWFGDKVLAAIRLAFQALVGLWG